jgi:uncharacterized protein YecT (DUF1311 family)
MLKTILFVMALAVPLVKSPGQKPAQPRCGELATQSDMNQCFAREAARINALLEALLNEIRTSLEGAQRTGLVAAQAQWVRYRDAHCTWLASLSEGGSIQPSVRATCLADTTWERIGGLKLTLCEGRGLTGPCSASRRYDRRRGSFEASGR